MPKPRQARAVPGKKKSSSEVVSAVRIGLVTGEPIRMEGLRSIFDQPAMPGHAPLMPIVGTMAELLANRSIEFLVVDMHGAASGLETLQSVRQVRSDMRQIVIGPENDEELVLDCVVAGARAYLDSSASPETVRQAIEIVVSGSIWAPRKLLSRLIDRLLDIPRSMVQTSSLPLTEREQQVLELILLARTNREIALQLGIEERTVKAHLGHIMKKTGAENRIDLSMRAINGSLMTGRRLQAR
jgi:DNA-binding NarL/FixJ family response regulator